MSSKAWELSHQSLLRNVVDLATPLTRKRFGYVAGKLKNCHIDQLVEGLVRAMHNHRSIKATMRDLTCNCAFEFTNA